MPVNLLRFSVFNFQSRYVPLDTLAARDAARGRRLETGINQGITMNNQSIEKLRVDTRLRRRRGWISDADLQRELDGLPDVSHKILEPDESEPSGGEEAGGSPEAVGSHESSAPAVGSPIPPAGGTAGPGAGEGGGV